MPRRSSGRSRPQPAAPVPGCAPLRSICPVASALDLLGDKWTLLVVRDLLYFDRHRFGELLAGGEAIATNILAERLERLEAAGVVVRRRYQERPPRNDYHLTAKGRALRPVLLEMVRWGSRHIAGTMQPPPGFLDRPPRRRAPRR
jgi:DNA-binding HxlR family transcriptional regulator